MKEVKARAIQVNDDPLITNDCISSIVILRENALSECTIVANNIEGAIYLSTLNLYDEVTVKYAYEEDEGDLDNDTNWDDVEPIFKGWIVELTPSLTVSGEVVSVIAMNGLGLKMMRVAQEYGLHSNALVFADPEAPESWVEYTAQDYFNEAVENDSMVDGTYLDNASNPEWTKEGTSPYLNDDDDSNITTHDVVTAENLTDVFTYADLDSKYSTFIPSNETNDCYLDVKAKLVDGANGHATKVVLEVMLWKEHSSSWDILGYMDVTSTDYQTARFTTLGVYLTDLDDWNNAKIMLNIYSIEDGGSDKGSVRVTYSYLHYKGTGYWYQNKGWCTYTGNVEYIDSISCPENSFILFHKACAYHEGRGQVKIYYRWGTSGDWVQIGDPITGDCYACRCVGGGNPNAPCGYPSNCTNNTDFITGPVNTTLYVKWRLEVGLLGTIGCFSNFRIYYNYPDSPEITRLEKLREILCNSKLGIVPKFIDNILGSNSSSYYEAINTDYIYNDTLDYTYLNFPYQDAFMCIQDLIRLGSAMHYLDNPSSWKGLHWIVQYDKDLDEHLLLIAPVGDHNISGIDDNHTVEDKWITKPLEDTPLIVRQDMVTQSFKTELPIANYVLVAGKYIRPVNEIWTESIEDWYHSSSSCNNPSGCTNVSVDINRKVGYYSIKCYVDNVPILSNPTTGIFYHPISEEGTVDFTKLITKDTVVKVHFQINRHLRAADLHFVVMNGLDQFIMYPINITEDEWNEKTITITKAVMDGTDQDWITPDGIQHVDWNNVSYIGFIFKVERLIDEEAWILVDDLWIEGNVIRGIYDNDSIEQYGCRFLTIKDSVASTDTLNSEDYTSPLAQLAIYELLRNRVVRTSGQIQIPLNPIFKGGQLVHIHACYDPNYTDGDGTHYRINKDFRISEVKHQFTIQGVFTLLTLTDDLYNSIPINNLDPYSMVMRMINPDYQTRTYASLKISGGDFSSQLKPITSPLPT